MYSTLPIFWNNGRTQPSVGLCLKMVMGHNLQLRCHFPLFHNFQWFNIKAAFTDHPVIQKKVDKLLAKGGIEPSTGVVVFVVYKHVGGF